MLTYICFWAVCCACQLNNSLILQKIRNIVLLEMKSEVIHWKKDQLGQADASAYCSTATFFLFIWVCLKMIVSKGEETSLPLLTHQKHSCCSGKQCGLGVQLKITCKPFSETACALPCGHVVRSVAWQKERKEKRSEGEVRRGHDRTCPGGLCSAFSICQLRHLKPAICLQPLASWAAQIQPKHTPTHITHTHRLTSTGNTSVIHIYSANKLAHRHTNY